MESDTERMLAELAHVLQTPLTAVAAGAELLGRLVPELRARQGDPLKELVRRNSVLLKQRIEELLGRVAAEGDTLVLRLTAADLATIHTCGVPLAAPPMQVAPRPPTPPAPPPAARPSLAAPVQVLTPAGEPPTPPIVGRGSTALVADDDRDMRTLLATALKEQGYQVTEATNGGDALAKIETGRPSILILDGLMPKIGGFELCRQAKALAPDYQPKVIIVTAVYKKSSYRYEAAKFGADDFLTKPFEVDELLQRVARLVKPAGEA